MKHSKCKPTVSNPCDVRWHWQHYRQKHKIFCMTEEKRKENQNSEIKDVRFLNKIYVSWNKKQGREDKIEDISDTASKVWTPDVCEIPRICVKSTINSETSKISTEKVSNLLYTYSNNAEISLSETTEITPQLVAKWHFYVKYYSKLDLAIWSVLKLLLNLDLRQLCFLNHLILFFYSSLNYRKTRTNSWIKN